MKKFESIHQRKILLAAKDNKRQKAWSYDTKKDISFAMEINRSCIMDDTNHTINCR